MKRYIVAFVVGESLKSNAICPNRGESPMECAKHIYDYIDSGVRILVEEKKPMHGDFHGDAVWALDCDTGYVWYAGF